jgi:hypothetical protein
VILKVCLLLSDLLGTFYTRSPRGCLHRHPRHGFIVSLVPDRYLRHRLHHLLLSETTQATQHLCTDYYYYYYWFIDCSSRPVVAMQRSTINTGVLPYLSQNQAFFHKLPLSLTCTGNFTICRGTSRYPRLSMAWSYPVSLYIMC